MTGIQTKVLAATFIVLAMVGSGLLLFTRDVYLNILGISFLVPIMLLWAYELANADDEEQAILAEGYQ